MTSTLELILRESSGSLLISLKKAAKILGRNPKTVRNLLSLKRFQLVPVRVGGAVMFRVADVAALIDSETKGGLQ